MKPTEQEIVNAGILFAKEDRFKECSQVEQGCLAFGYSEGLEHGISQMQPEWVAVNSPADLPTDNKSYWCEMKDGTVECRDGFTIRHFGVLRYTPVVKPQPPTK